MNEQVKEYLEKYPEEIRELYGRLRQLILDASSQVEPEEQLWTKLPSYTVGEKFVRLIPFRDHINVEARAILEHKYELAGYKLTPKGMLQLGLKQEIPASLLRTIFEETLIDTEK